MGKRREEYWLQSIRIRESITIVLSVHVNSIINICIVQGAE